MKKVLFFSILLIPALLSAQNTPRVDTQHGYRVALHTNKGGVKPTFEDEIVADIKVYVGDSLMQASKSFAPDGFKATLPTQDEFENNPSAPAIFDAALMMGIGDSATAYMKLDTFIRNTLPLRLRKFDAVRYEIKLLNVVSGEVKRQETAKIKASFAGIAQNVSNTATEYRNGTLKNVVAKPSGLKMLVTEKGTGTPVAKGQQIAVHYYGALTNGTMFDNSFERAEPIVFPAGTGQMIPGFDEGVVGLPRGSKAYLFIPPALGYGAEGSGPIPANSELVFYIEIQ
jgi:FKBP-type peptidyl-prolyl cis-trans isomerase